MLKASMMVLPSSPARLSQSAVMRSPITFNSFFNPSLVVSIFMPLTDSSRTYSAFFLFAHLPATRLRFCGGLQHGILKWLIQRFKRLLAFCPHHWRWMSMSSVQHRQVPPTRLSHRHQRARFGVELAVAQNLAKLRAPRYIA